MTEDEFLKILGDEWKPGNGKVDWLTFWPGKVSQQYVIMIPSLMLHMLTFHIQSIKTITTCTCLSPCDSKGPVASTATDSAGGEMGGC